MKKLLLYILLLGVFTTYSQEEASNWYFGENAGIQFSNDGSITILNDGQLNTLEGCSSISDSNGNLLFYTDGITVYNRQHNILSNGFGLLGDPSSSQSAIVVPKPNNPDIYYIFTVGSNSSQTGLKYSEVDMTLDGGLGAITQKNINLLNKCSEKVSAVLKDCTSQSIWVITLSNVNGSSTSFLNSFHAFEVSTAGVNTTSVVSSFNNLNISDLRGYLKLSPNGEKLACANVQSGGLLLFDFDKQTGIVSNELRLNINSPYNEPYGVEFSPNSNLLYVSSSNDLFGPTDHIPSNHHSTITQFNLTATDIVASQVVIDQQNLFRSALQLGPNGKIYRSMAATYAQGYPFLSVINNPNEIGQACDYQNNAINLGNNNSTQGLPPFISSFFIEKIDIINNTVTPIATNYLPLCIGETYTLQAENVQGATYTWFFNNNPLPNTEHFLTVNQSGHYEVLIELNSGSCDFLEGEAFIEYFPIPIANPIPNFELCDDNDDEILNFDLTIQNAPILGTQDSNIYSTHYFESLSDANSYQNEITEIYENQTNPQEIFARVDLTGSPNCYSITSFFLVVNPLPELEDETVYYCLNIFPQTIPLSAGILNDSPANYTYLWSTGETTETIQINQIGDYTVTATNIHGCTMSKTVTVEPSNIATFEDIIIVDATENNTVTVLVSGEGIYEYALHDQDGLYATFQSSNIFYNVYGGIYTVSVRDIKNNCGIVTQNISVIDFPKFFTPNGDGINDTWNIKGVSEIFQPNTMIRIFDRYGKLVKQLNPLGIGWDGTFNGEFLPTSDYWFFITLQDGREFQNHFTLKR
ncbi:T9SS type B sorting domain-containing protein [Formosa maritima]|uniref:T9SS type B sorting domain-containing protein n=1 Tax=Formosa maritima TaxID=2592046 RepID=A0A5D0G7T4_9FLAO|nr:T9SS type B sorting domain-containing protein [Formosa maritima]TYA53892.1 T9SS type B sorting domain-containing protein [Formosa maritima]